MYTPTMPIGLPNPGMPPEGFPSTPEKYKRINDLVEFPDHNHGIEHYEIDIRFPNYDKDCSTGHNLDYKIIRFENNYAN